MAAPREGFPPGNRSVWPGAPLLNNYRGPTVVPHNVYRTRGGGANDWCVIACFADAEWRNLVQLMGSPGWAADAQLATLQGRLAHQETLDQGIQSWTRTFEKYDLSQKCQAAGVRAMPVQSSEDRVNTIRNCDIGACMPSWSIRRWERKNSNRLRSSSPNHRL